MASSSSAMTAISTFEAQSSVLIPRVAIKFCTQCKWNLRAAYFAQELLQTFSTTLGEVALQPSSGGIFTITLYHPVRSASVAVHADPIVNSASTVGMHNNNNNNPAILPQRARARAPSISTSTTIRETLIWDRKRDGGFPDTKELKNRVRNLVEPDRDLGHIDRSLGSANANTTARTDPTTTAPAPAPAKGRKGSIVSVGGVDVGSIFLSGHNNLNTNAHTANASVINNANNTNMSISEQILEVETPKAEQTSDPMARSPSPPSPHSHSSSSSHREQTNPTESVTTIEGANQPGVCDDCHDR